MNYSIVPFKKFYCTQNYNQAPTHYKQSQSKNGVKAYPIDIVDDIYCGCNEMIVVKINGVGTKTVNQIFIQSTKEVQMPIGKHYITYLITHPCDEDIKKNLYVGKKFKRNDFIIHKGTDGGVGAHIDFVIAKSKQSGWTMSSYKEYILPDSIKPEDGMYLDEEFTNMENPNGINFTKLPKIDPVEIDNTVNQVQVICGKNTLYLRNKAGLNGEIIGFAEPGVYNIIDIKEQDDYKWYNISNNVWFANAEGCTTKLYYYSYDQLPIGSQIKMVNTNIPANYLLCNGLTYDTDKYSELYNVLKSKTLPNDGFIIKCKNIIKL